MNVEVKLIISYTALVVLAMTGVILLIWYVATLIQDLRKRRTSRVEHDQESGQSNEVEFVSTLQPGINDQPPAYFHVEPSQKTKIMILESIQEEKVLPPSYQASREFKNLPFFHRSISEPIFTRRLSQGD